MTDLLRQGSDLLESIFESNASQTVVFEKIDTKERAELAATIGGNGSDAQENLNLSTDFDSLDFVIRKHTLVTLTPAPQTQPTFGDWLNRDPQQNDKIHWNGFVYIISPVFGNESWRYTDGFHTSLRIHTKKVE